MNDLATRLTQHLNRVDRDQSHPNTRPRDAATMILIDRSGSSPQVLLGRRHHGHKFLPGKFVFPGGRVEPSDRFTASATALHPHVEGVLLRRVRNPSPAKARSFALAAIRETFEETGMLLGARRPAGLDVPSPPWMPAGKDHIVPDLAQIHFVARAVTPPRRPRRFDTRFFAVDAQMIADRIEGVIGPNSELVELVWIPINDATQLDLPPITIAVLEELKARSAAGFSHELPVPFYQMLQKQFRRSLL